MVNSRHRIAIAPIKKTRWSLVSWKAIALPLLIAAAGGAESPVAAQCIFPGPETQGVLLTIPANSPPNVGSSIVTLNNYSEAAPLNVVTVSVVQFSVQPG